MTHTKDGALNMALEALQNNRRAHYSCEDSWYSCPKQKEIQRRADMYPELIGALEKIAKQPPINSDYKVEAAREALREIARAAIAFAKSELKHE